MVLVLGALGCSPMHKAAGGYGGDYGRVYEGHAYGGEYGYDDYAYAEEAPAADYDKSVARGRSGRQDLDTKFKSEQRSPSPTTVTTETRNGPDDPAPPPEAEPEPDQTSTQIKGRQIIYTAGLGLSVFDVDDVMIKLEAIPERHGGWLHQRFDNRVVLRVPAAKLSSIIAEIGEWGVVEWKTLEALDVTAEYTDLDSRIRVLEQMQKHLQALLARAQNVEQALEIQVELARITAELERLRAQMRMLESSIAFSTLAVELRERNLATVEPRNDPFPWVDQLGAEATAYR